MLKLEDIGFSSLTKRLMDLLVASGLLFLTFPVFIITAVAIKLDSRGPVFFRQMRTGKGQRQFICYKFRSMYVGSNSKIHQEYIKELMTEDSAQKKQSGKVFKLTDDPRITPVGRLIRKLSIDELPQLFNVLKGQMSMVGPRPAIFYELKYHTDAMLKRFTVKPGITGLWQISGRSALGYKEMVALDISYIDHWSTWLDLRIILKTVLYVLKISHAY